MNLIFFDDGALDLLPFTYTRPVADLRCGIFTARERWQMLLGAPIDLWLTGAMPATGSITQPHLQGVFPCTEGEDSCFINGGVIADAALGAAVRELGPNQALVHDDTLIAVRRSRTQALNEQWLPLPEGVVTRSYGGEPKRLRRPWDIFSLNDWAIKNDFTLITSGRTSAPVPAGVTVSGNNLFIEQGAKIYPGCVINASAGPVYIGPEAEILEGTLIRGPLATLQHSVVKMGAKIYGATTIGPGCKVGGEINNAVFFANSNKAHDGYLGNAVIGEWCNLGADTNCSNLKNNYDEVKVWSIREERLVSTGLTFCGLMMGDHSKCGINTMFNTGTTVGVSCNIFGGGFPEKYIPSFSWGGNEGMEPYAFHKAIETADRMMGRRSKKLSDGERDVLRHIFDSVHPKKMHN